MVLEKTLECPLDCKEIQPVHSKGNQSWIFIGRTDVEAEAPIIWPTDAKDWLIWKDPDAGKGWRLEEKGRTEDETVGWHHRLSQCEFEQARELVMDREACRGAVLGVTELDTTEGLNWTDNWLILYVSFRLSISYLSTVISYFNTLRRQSIVLLTLVEHVQVGCLKFFSTLCMSIKYYKSMTIIDVGVYKYILVSRWICRYGIHE